MDLKKIGLIVLGGVTIFSCLLNLAFLAIPQFSYSVLMALHGTPMQVLGTSFAGGQPGFGMMGNGRMMGGAGGGMMGGFYNNQTAPAPSNGPSSGASSSAASSATTGRSRGSTGGLTAVVNNQAVPNLSDVTLPENTAMQKIGNLNVTLALTPYPPASFQTGNFEITLTDEKGQAITDAQVKLDLTMPAMPMPPSKPEAKHVSDGKYTASALWTMRGQWRIAVIIARGGATQTAFFDVWL